MKNVMNKISKFTLKFSSQLKKRLINLVKNIFVYIKTNLLVGVFLIVNIINGIMLRFLTVKNQFAIKPVLGDLTFLIAIVSFCYFIKPKKQIRYLFIFSVIFSIVCFINCVYYSNYISFASFSMLSTATELTGYTDAVIQNILEFKDFIF